MSYASGINVRCARTNELIGWLNIKIYQGARCLQKRSVDAKGHHWHQLAIVTNQAGVMSLMLEPNQRFLFENMEMVVNKKGECSEHNG